MFFGLEAAVGILRCMLQVLNCSLVLGYAV